MCVDGTDVGGRNCDINGQSVWCLEKGKEDGDGKEERVFSG